MRQIGFQTAADMYSTFAGQQSDMDDWLQGAQINTDQNLRLMYLAGWGINSHIEEPLYDKMLAMRRPPLNIFEGNMDSLDTLFGEMMDGGPR
jgi:hypothetical protein